jgi:hypothetical protein
MGLKNPIAAGTVTLSEVAMVTDLLLDDLGFDDGE